MSDKRKIERLNIQCIITIKDVFPQPPKNQIVGKCMDISTAGVKIHSHEDIEADSMVNINLNLKPYKEQAEVIGQIKWKHVTEKESVFQYGIEFLEQNQDLDKILNRIDKIGKLKEELVAQK